MKWIEVRSRSQVKGPAAVDGQWKCTRGLQANAGGEKNTFPCVGTTEVNMDSGLRTVYNWRSRLHSVLWHYESNLRLMLFIVIYWFLWFLRHFFIFSITAGSPNSTKHVKLKQSESFWLSQGGQPTRQPFRMRLNLMQHQATLLVDSFPLENAPLKYFFEARPLNSLQVGPTNQRSEH